MNIPDPRFIVQFTAPVTFRGVDFNAARVEIINDVAGFANGYRFRPLRAEDSTKPEPVWVEIGGEYFAPDAAPIEANALAMIEAFLAGPSEAEQLAGAKTALKARATHRRWEVEVGGVLVGGMPVATDDRSKTLLLQADREARENSVGAEWKGADGEWIELSAAQVRACAAAMSAHVRICFLREKALHVLIKAAPDLVAIEALKPEVEAFELPE